MSPVPWTGRDTMGGIHSRCATSRRIYASGRPPSYRTRDSWVKKGGCPHFFPKEGRASCAILPRRTEKAHLERIDFCPNFTLIVCTSAGRGAFARGEGAGRLHDVSGCPAPRSPGTALHRYTLPLPCCNEEPVPHSWDRFQPVPISWDPSPMFHVEQCRKV